MIILALDIGDKRIGIAKNTIIDDLALPLETLNRKNLTYDLNYIKDLVEKYGAERLVCGLPVNFDGSESVQTTKTQFFIDKLKEVLTIPIDTMDERCTTMQAKDVLLEADVSRKDRKLYIDKISALYILNDYMTKLKNGDKK